MPTIHWQPMAMTEGMKGCGGCHKLGLKSADDAKKLAQEGRGFGMASCDACHTRHTFSVAEARQPQACQTCHMGFDHPQWEMYSASKHGVRYAAQADRACCRRARPRPPARPATCRTATTRCARRGASWRCGCPCPRTRSGPPTASTILQALGVLDPAGKPTARLDVVKAADVARLDQALWQKERDKMLATCGELPLGRRSRRSSSRRATT